MFLKTITKNCSLLIKKPIVYGIIVAIIFISAGYSGLGNIKTPLKNYFAHSWRSIKKFPNIVYLPFWFGGSNLSQLQVFIDIKDIEELNSGVPIDMEEMDYGPLLDSDKSYVNAYFVGDDGYESKIKLRYRGLMQNHWQAEQKSFKIKFPKDNLFQGMRELNLIIPLDREFYVASFNSYRAKKMGVLAPDIKFVRLRINKRDFGVYLASEAWSTELLDKNGIADVNNILSNKDVGEAGISGNTKAPFSGWKSYTAENEEGPFEELEMLGELVSRAPDDVFYKYIDKLVDLDKFYRWQLITVLSGSAHQSDNSNLVLLFRRETGKFEPVVWDIESEELGDEIYSTNQPLLVRRIFKNETYSKKFLEILGDYVEDESNLADDLDYYDSIIDATKNDFYSDQAKNENNFVFNRMNSDNRDLIIKNFRKVKELLATENIKEVNVSDGLSFSDKLNFVGSFKYLPSTVKSIDQFIAENPQFKKSNNKTLVINAGSHVFYKTIIVPAGFRLIIEPGARLLFNPGVSLITYSPVTANGHISNPITMTSSYPGSDKPWGVFATVNTGIDKNYFRNIIVSGGSEDTVNGLRLTSQFSLHNAESLVEGSVFKNGKSDDGFHAIIGTLEISNSLFENNSSDGIDLDFIKSGRIENSRFINNTIGGNNGDAIDLSGTSVEIKNNQLLRYGDKCISVGEKSTPIISGNIIAGCNIGIAVKDASYAVIDNNKVVGNISHGLYLYRKKPSFINGGKARVSRSIIWGNSAEIEKDGFSGLTIEDSVVEGGYEGGTAIRQADPELNKILPASMYNLIFGDNKND
ncbi:MAG: CotH kinase family protein [Candidatus Yanofskybacteria bacterium]|nr:CotH kinase family protein [Candidatus Yanofskybacteria bacterium]